MPNQTSKYPGMGTVLIDGGVSFRLWAPHAQKVAVTGQFNNWSNDSHPMGQEADGNWSCFVPGAKNGDRYKFVVTEMKGQVSLKNDPYARSLSDRDDSGKLLGVFTNSVINDRDYKWEVDFQIDDWNKLVIYEMHVGTFTQDADNAYGKRGTFKSAESKLDYLRDLGINAIEIMAAGEFPFDISWGYNPTFIYAIEESYGGPDQFRMFVDACHKRGIAVIFDVVYNHLGPEELDMWQFDGWSENELGGIYFYNDWRASTPWGDTRPDYGRDEVRAYIHDNAMRWVQKRGADGLRWDATNYIRNKDGSNDSGAGDIAEGWSLMQWINNDLQQNMPGTLSIAEDMQNNEWLTKSTNENGAGFGAQWDSRFVHEIRQSIVHADDSSRDMQTVASVLSSKFNDDSFQRVIYTESHDENANGKSRVPEEICPGNAQSYFAKKRSTLGAALALTAPGIPMLFQGQEFVEDRYFSDEFFLDWNKAESNSGIVNLYRDLIKLRRNWENRSAGLTGQNIDVFHINNSEKVIAFHRWQNGGEGDDVVVVANFSDQNLSDYRIGLPREGAWKVRFNSDWNGYSPDFGNFYSHDTNAEQNPQDGLACSGIIGIGAYSLILLTQGAD